VGGVRGAMAGEREGKCRDMSWKSRLRATLEAFSDLPRCFRRIDVDVLACEGDFPLTFFPAGAQECSRKSRGRRGLARDVCRTRDEMCQIHGDIW
jgi:hypothetical protein